MRFFRARDFNAAGIQRGFDGRGRAHFSFSFSRAHARNSSADDKISMTLATLLFGYFVAFVLSFVMGALIKGIFSLFYYTHYDY